MNKKKIFSSNEMKIAKSHLYIRTYIRRFEHHFPMIYYFFRRVSRRYLFSTI